MRIGIVSDSHGNLENTRRAVQMLTSLDVEQVLHCGDIGGPAIPACFARWPTHFVLGNVDDDPRELQRVVEAAGLFWHGSFGELELAGRRIAFLHSDDARRFRETVAAGTWDLVCYGHTHVAAQRQVGPTLVLNPGALHRARPPSIAIVDLPPMAATIVPLD